MHYYSDASANSATETILTMLGQFDERAPCPLCASPNVEWRPGPDIDKTIRCRVCGCFVMDFKLIVDRDMRGTPHPYLSAATRKASEMGALLTLTMDNWQGLEQEQRSIRVSQKLADLLRLIAAHSKTLGQQWRMNLERDYPLVAAADSVELSKLLAHLYEKGYLAEPTDRCELTVAGWEAIEPRPRTGGIPGQCFVAMWFSNETLEAYDLGIEPAIRQAEFNPIRIDRKEHNNEIPDQIMAEIRNCQFMVADFTGQRGVRDVEVVIKPPGGAPPSSPRSDC